MNDNCDISAIIPPEKLKEVLTYDFTGLPHTILTVLYDDNKKSAGILLSYFKNDGSIKVGDVVDTKETEIQPIIFLNFDKKYTTAMIREALDEVDKIIDRGETENV